MAGVLLFLLVAHCCVFYDGQMLILLFCFVFLFLCDLSVSVMFCSNPPKTSYIANVKIWYGYQDKREVDKDEKPSFYLFKKTQIFVQSHRNQNV